MWKVTPSKSDTVWSMLTGVALVDVLAGAFEVGRTEQHTPRTALSVPTESEHSDSLGAASCVSVSFVREVEVATWSGCSGRLTRFVVGVL